MITVEKYIDNNIKLIKSLTIKSNDTAVHINKELVKKYGSGILGLIASDKTKWKYYMNLCGEYHMLDNPIKITVIETGTIEDLTKELLKKYTTTHKELLKYDIFYNELLNRYPDQELLIKGIMHDLDMEYVLSVEDGEILSYSPTYVEEQESNIIDELSVYGINFFKRWHIREYSVIDNLYIPSLLATLYTKLVLKVLNIRYNNAYTSNVHSFHMDEFFRSHFDVDTSVLNKQTRFWLYKNMRYIRKNIGSNETLNIIIEKIITNNGIGIAEIELINSLPDIQLLNLDDHTKPLYDKKINSFVSNPKNDFYINSDSDNIDSYGMLLLQFNKNLVENDMVIKNTIDIENKHLPKLDRNILHRQKTKSFKIKINKNYIVTQEVTMKLLLDNWAYLAYTDKFRVNKKFIDPNTGITYNLTPKQGLLMLFKVLAGLAGHDNPIISGFNANNIINENVLYEDLSKGLLRDDVLKTIIDKAYSKIPKTSTYVGEDTFYTYINEIVTYRSMLWNVASNTTDMLLSSDMQILYRRLHKSVFIDFGDNKTIDELISNELMYFDIGENYDYITVIKDLFLLFTGHTIGDDGIEEKINKYIEITKKLSSYTVQFISNKNDLNIIPLRYSNIDTINSGIVDLHDSTFRALEDFYGYLDAVGVLYTNFLKNDYHTDLVDGNKLNEYKLIAYDTKHLDSDLIIHSQPNLYVCFDAGPTLYSPNIDSRTYDNSLGNNFNILNKDIINNYKLTDNNLRLMSYDSSSSLNPTVISITDSDGVLLYKPQIENNIFNINVDNDIVTNIGTKIDGDNLNTNIQLLSYSLEDEVVISSNVITINNTFEPKIDNE